MTTIFVHVLLIALILPLGVLLATHDDGRAATNYRAPAAVVLALAVVFFALGALHPVDAPGAWAFRGFYGGLAALTAAAANLLVCLERSQA